MTKMMTITSNERERVGTIRASAPYDKATAIRDARAHLVARKINGSTARLTDATRYKDGRVIVGFRW